MEQDKKLILLGKGVTWSKPNLNRRLSNVATASGRTLETLYPGG